MDDIVVLHAKVLYLIHEDRFEDAYFTQSAVNILLFDVLKYPFFTDAPNFQPRNFAKRKGYQLVYADFVYPV